LITALLKLTLATAPSFVFTQKNTPGVYLCKTVEEWEKAGGKWFRVLSLGDVQRDGLPSQIMPLTRPSPRTTVCNVCGTTFNQVVPARFDQLTKHLDCAQHKAAMAAAVANPDWQPAPLVGQASWIEYVR
jgi:hypothetical protein